MYARVASFDRHMSPERAAREVRHKPVHRTKQSRLAGTGRSRNQDEGSLRERKRTVNKSRFRALRVGKGDVFECDRVLHFRLLDETTAGIENASAAATSAGDASGHARGNVDGSRPPHPPTAAAPKTRAAATVAVVNIVDAGDHGSGR